MKIVLTGGITGGHIYPALAIGAKFKEHDSYTKIIYISEGDSLERKIIEGAGYPFLAVSVSPLDRKNIAKLFNTALKTIKGKHEAYKILKSFKPDIVISTGSYTSVPVVMAAKKYGVPVYIHEQNGFAGISNKMMAKYANVVFLGFEAARKFFDKRKKIVYSGNPVRAEFENRDKHKDREKLDIHQEDFVITVFGGSLGSDMTNDIGKQIAKKFAGKSKCTLIWGTGSDYYESIIKEMQDLALADNVRIKEFIKDMPTVISASDLVISRSGALTVAEVSMVGRAAIFIPSPNVTEDHQYYNAKALADAGGAFIVREDENTLNNVMNIIDDLEKNMETLTVMEKSSRKVAPTDATEIIYNTIIEDLKETNRLHIK